MTDAYTYPPILNQSVHASAHEIAAPADAVFPLLCPTREYEWIPGWTCRLVHTVSGVAEPGCVFVTERADGATTWFTVEHDAAARRVAFVRVNPARRALLMSLRVEPLGPERCRLHVSYRVSGLTPEGVEEARRGVEGGKPYAEHAAGLAALAERFLRSGETQGIAPGALRR